MINSSNAGRSSPIGATVENGGVNFSLFPEPLRVSSCSYLTTRIPPSHLESCLSIRWPTALITGMCSFPGIQARQSTDFECKAQTTR